MRPLRVIGEENKLISPEVEAIKSGSKERSTGTSAQFNYTKQA
jgi:hypothetical protein